MAVAKPAVGLFILAGHPKNEASLAFSVSKSDAISIRLIDWIEAQWRPLFALTKEAARHLNTQFAERQIEEVPCVGPVSIDSDLSITRFHVVKEASEHPLKRLGFVCIVWRPALAKVVF